MKRKFSYEKAALEMCESHGTVFIYFSKPGELDTKGIIRKLLRAGKRAVLPRCISATRISCHEIKNLDDVEKGKYGIMEPKAACKRINRRKIGIFFVPGTQFDLHGNRKGHGKGYFDRFLAKVRDRSVVGMCKDGFLKKKIASKSHDVRVSVVLTDKRIVDLTGKNL